VHPILFALLGAARRERSTADYVRMSDGYDQAALLAELEALLIAGEWSPPIMTAELACQVVVLVRSGIRVAKLRLVAPSPSSLSSQRFLSCTTSAFSYRFCLLFSRRHHSIKFVFISLQNKARNGNANISQLKMDVINKLNKDDQNKSYIYIYMIF
jgi:hypothetical protein